MPHEHLAFTYKKNSFPTRHFQSAHPPFVTPSSKLLPPPNALLTGKLGA